MRSVRAIGVVLSALFIGAAAAGPLDPPAGPIAPTPGPEPRTPVNATNTPGDNDSVFKITQPGSYYLTGNLVVDVPSKMGIEIAAPNVTLDLNGFTVSCTKPGPYDGISNTTAEPRNITVLNGTVENFGGDGIDITGIGGDGIRIVGVHARQNSGHGILTAKTATIEGCTAVVNGLNGIWSFENATIRTCQSLGNGQHGIVVGVDPGVGSNSVVEGCTSVGNGLDGIVCLSNAAVANCSASGNGSDGFAVQGMCSVTACSSKENTGNGYITAAAIGAGGTTSSGRYLFSGCQSSLNGQNGFVVNGSEGSIERCAAASNALDGIQCADRVRVVGNSCAANGLGFSNGANIHVIGTFCHIEGNTVISADRGIDVDTSGNLIIRNMASSNGVNFDIVANNKVGVIVTAPNSGVILGSTGGAGVGSTDPTANIVY